jgi:subtilisin family serine protease
VNHGTHVSGLAAARAGNSKGVTGVMGTGAKIMMLNVFGSHDGADGAAIANAIRYAADNGADVINMSLGGEGKDAAYEAAIAYAIKKGSMIVVAAGNETKEVGSKYFAIPAAYAGQYEGLVAVAAIETQTLKLTSYSNWSTSTVEIAAPGSENSKTYTGLLSTLPGNKYGREEGTSMASPVVAGAAALAISTLRDHGYQTSPELIENVLLKSARVDKTLTAKIAEGRVLDVKGLADYINTSYPVVAAPAPAPTATPQPGQPAPSATPAPTAPPVTSSNCPAETTY